MSEDLSVDYLKGDKKFEELLESDKEFLDFQEKLKDKIIELQIEPPEKIQEEINFIKEKFQAEIDDLAVDIKLPSIYFVPSKDKVELIRAFGDVGISIAENNLGFSGVDFSVIFYREEMSMLDMSSLVYHEMRHGTKYSKRMINSKGQNSDFINGGSITTLYGEEKGDLFEEGFVLYDTEKYIHERLSKSMSGEYEIKKKLLPQLSHNEHLKNEFFHETFLDTITEDSTSIEGSMQPVDDHFMMKVFQAMEEKIPNIVSIVSEARLKGKWGNVAKMIDGEYGKGMFKVLMDTPEDLSIVAHSAMEGWHTVASARKALKELKNNN